MEINYDVIIVGGGVIGSSIAYFLTKNANHKVLLCDKNKPPNGATNISGGLLRVHHTNIPNQILSYESLKLFKNLKSEEDMDFGYKSIGFSLLVGKKNRNNLKINAGFMKDLGVPYEIFTPEEYVKKEKEIKTDDVGAICHEPLGGFGDPTKTTNTFLKHSLSQGLDLMEGTKVNDLLIKENKVIGVKTNHTNVYAEKVVLACNFWSKALLKKLELDVPLLTKRLGIVFVKHRLTDQILSHSYIDDTSDTYMRPFDGKRLLIGIKSATCGSSRHSLSKFVQPEEATEAIQRASKRFPVLKGASVLGGRIGFESYTPDQHPIIGPSNKKGLYLAIGFSGGGYKIAPAVGDFVSQEITKGVNHPILKYYRVNRFDTKQTHFQTQSMYNFM